MFYNNDRYAADYISFCEVANWTYNNNNASVSTAQNKLSLVVLTAVQTNMPSGKSLQRNGRRYLQYHH